ncbi:hypothetical protein K227x_59180 [Rubripirellula lacrimiformis]|uniref:Uncharacterized protein n=2 Tax=Rubripirellula lacrimiformis TaxID=1930273 RepID=A0A517NK29_9BACT|nr:hypothetical protein K227x_59180 [Rubripirellula lacrimiformis]
MRDEMVRMAAPGLPGWPTLMFDEKRRRAIVKARFATWRSHEWAMKTTRCLGVCLFLWLSVRWWRMLGDEPSKWFPFLLGGMVVCLIAALGYRGIDAATKGFFARQVFAKRMTVWLTPEAIGFRSSMYENGVVMPRVWKGQAVAGRFDVTKDHRANLRKQLGDFKSNGKSQHLEMAQLLRLLVTTVNSNVSIGGKGQPNYVRSLPMTEISQLDSERMTVVLAAAEALTSAALDDEFDVNATGIDIDAT